jgi:hypothetical protein
MYTQTHTHTHTHTLTHTHTQMYVGMSNVPWHAEVVAFSKEVAALVSVEFRA